MKKFFLFAATLLGLVACNKNEADINVPARQITIHATADMNNGSAASGPHRIAPNDITASSVSFYWQEGDKVWVLSEDFSEKQIFTIDNSSINGNQANFTGTALSDMSSYYVIYLDNMVSEETLMASISAEDSVTYNYNPDSKNWFFIGQGQEDNFTLGCDLTIRMQLKGSCKLSKVTLLWMNSSSPEGYAPATTTINFVHGSYDGLQLTSTPVEVVMPLSIRTVDGFTLRFYDTDGNLIMEKSKEGSSLYNDLEDYGMVNLGVLEVVAPTPHTPVYVDLGLPSGTLWADCNVGATCGSTAASWYGDYFAWGEVAKKSDYATDWSNYFDFKEMSGSTPIFNKYNKDAKTLLDETEDVASVQWGSSWCMPTKEQCYELMLNCNFTWETDYLGISGLNGFKLVNKTDETKFIFLPAAGYQNGTEKQQFNNGLYWSKTLYTDYSMDRNAYYLSFYYTNPSLYGFILVQTTRYTGIVVRPVANAE